VRDAEQGLGMQVWVGGGQGRTPKVGVVLREFLPLADLLSYTEAILRIYNLFGRRDNKYKARIKILVAALGIEQFAALVEAEWLTIRDSVLRLEEADITAMRAHFPRPAYQPAAGEDVMTATWAAMEPEFSRWLKRNTRAHRQAGYRAVVVSLKAPDVAPGDITDTQMDALATLAERYSFGEIRATYDQNMVLADVRETDLHALWRALDELGLATANIGLLTDMICCPGLDFCSLANARSIPIAAQINARFADLDYLHDIGELELKMSGCMNACGHHHVGHIGILGVDKNGVEFYQITLGGVAGDGARLGERLGPAITADAVADTIESLLSVYVELREGDERFIDTVARCGVAPFKDRAYALAA
jgi:sulfite reductase (NADPH) hemoprotein beta-component